MALFDNSLFDSSTYNGAMPGWLQQALQSGLLGRALPPQQQDQPQVGPTYASGNQGMMGGVPFPIVGANNAGGMAGAQSLPPNAAPAGPAPGAPPQPPAAPQPQPGSLLGGPQPSDPGILARLSAGFHNLGAGGGLIPGLLDAAQGFTSGVRLDPRGMQQQQLQATYESLVKSGVPDAQAKAAALNPELLKQIAPEYFGGFKVVQVGEGPLGKTFKLQGPNGRFYDIPENGAPPGSPTGASPTGMTTNQSLLAPGVKTMNSALTGEEYLNQFSPEVKAAVKAYINGDVMPTGNPRLQGIAPFAKTVAQKYGQDLGIPVSDATYASKRKMQMDIGSSSPNSIGGIISNGLSAFSHLANLSDKMVDLGNYNGPDVPGGGHLATIGNVAANVVAPSSATNAKIAAFNDNSLKYGQESTKFYAGTGGGEAERMHALSTLNPKTSSANEQAAFLETEKQLMLERLHQKEIQIENVLGPDYLKQHPIRTAELNATIAKIDANIAKLRGTNQAEPAAPGAPSQADIAAEMKRRGLLK